MASASTSTSPPRTPVDLRTAAAINTARNSATPTSDDSYIEDLSFDYVQDENGNLKRITKGSSKASPQVYTPPTPPDDIEPEDFKKPPSPISLNSPVVRSPLSRSESAYSILETVASYSGDKLERPARSFSRITSGPVLSGASSHTASTASSVKPRTIPRRVTLDEAPDRGDLGVSLSRSRQALDPHLYTCPDDKENTSETDENLHVLGASGKRRHSPPWTSRSGIRTALRTMYTSGSGTRQAVDVMQRPSQARQVPVPNRAGRMIKTLSASFTASKQSSLDRYHDTDLSESDYDPSPPAGVKYGDRNVHGGIESDTGDDGENDPVNAPVSGSMSSNVYGKQKSILGSAAAASSLHRSSASRQRRSASMSEGIGID